MYKAKYLSPRIPSFDIEKTASFFTDLLDFTVGRDDKTYMVLYKDNVTLHILRAGSDIGETEFYLEVDNVDRVWDSMKDKLAGIKVKEPFDQEYGMREVHIIVPDTNVGHGCVFDNATGIVASDIMHKAALTTKHTLM